MAEALFLDRDGVINADSGDFIRSVAEWDPIPGSLEAIARLCSADFRIVVVTNQSGIARGIFDEAVLAEIHTRMRREIEAAGGELAGVFHCPHLPEAGCLCRKPRPGLIDRACEELGIEAGRSSLIGDRLSDLGAARAAGCRPILVRSGVAIPEDFESEAWRDALVYRDLAEATDALLAERR